MAEIAIRNDFWIDGRGVDDDLLAMGQSGLFKVTDDLGAIDIAAAGQQRDQGSHLIQRDDAFD